MLMKSSKLCAFLVEMVIFKVKLCDSGNLAIHGGVVFPAFPKCVILSTGSSRSFRTKRHARVDLNVHDVERAMNMMLETINVKRS